MAKYKYYFLGLLLLATSGLSAVCKNCSTRKFLRRQIQTDAQNLITLTRSLGGVPRNQVGEFLAIFTKISTSKGVKEEKLGKLKNCSDCII